MRDIINRIAAVLAGSMGWASAQAAGGHHAVEDAAILDPGRCHAESWTELRRGSDYFVNVAPACRLGGLEWTLGLERERAGSDGAWGLAPQVKAAWPLGESAWAAGAVLAAGWRHEDRHWESRSLLVPLSLSAGAFELHLNVGYDWQRDEPDDWRYGAAMYRHLAGAVDGVLEVFNEADTWYGQLGLRWHPGHEGASVDLGYARSESSARERWVTIGLSYEFSR
jgi:hypothetical protein